MQQHGSVGATGTDSTPRNAQHVKRRRGRRSAVALAAAGLAIVGATATPAAAHESYHRVNLSGSIFIHDDDLWPNPDDNGTHIFSGSVTVGREIFSKTFTTSGCVGGEVKGELTVIVEDQTSSQVKVRVRGRLFERDTCPNSDLDGDSGEKVVWVPLGSTRTLTFRVHNGEWGDGGYNDYTLRVQNLQA